jgi:chaperone BCS1
LLKKKIDDTLNIEDVLQVLDGVQYLKGCITVMTTNYIDKVDEALIRSGRIDHKIEFTHCGFDEIIEIIDYYCTNTPEKNQIRKDLEGFDKKVTTSFVINTIVFPRYDNYDEIIEKLVSKFD